MTATVLPFLLSAAMPAGCYDTPHGAAFRYAWDDRPDCDLATEAGLPVGPFELPVLKAR